MFGQNNNNNFHKDSMNSSTPQFNGGWMAIVLIGDIIRNANGALMSANYKEYYNSLEAWYNEVFYRLEDNKNIPKEDIIKLNEAQKASVTLNPEHLKKYHRALNLVTNKAKLRIRDASNVPGVVQHG